MSGPGFLQGFCTAPETHNSEANEDRTKYCDPNPNLGVIHGNGHRDHIHEALTKYNASRKRSGRGEKGELSGFISDPYRDRSEARRGSKSQWSLAFVPARIPHIQVSLSTLSLTFVTILS